MTIRTTLLASALVSTSLVVVVGSIGTLNRRVVEQDLRGVEQASLPVVRALDDMRFAGLRVVSSTSEYVLIRAVARLPVDIHPMAPTETRSGSDPDADDHLEGGAESGSGEVRLRRVGVELYGQALAALDSLVTEHQVRFGRTRITRAGDALLAASAHLLELADTRADGVAILEAKELFEQQELAFLVVIEDEAQQAAAHLNARSAGVRDRVTHDYRVSIVVLLGASLLALWVGLQLASTIRRPLEVLRRASVAITEGQPVVSLPTGLGNEIGAVARAFQTMATTLASTTVSNTLLDDIIVSIPDGLLVVDAAGRVTRANRAAADLMSEGETLVGRLLTELLPAIGSQLSRRTAVITEVSSARGPAVPATIAVSPLTGRGGRAQGWVILVQDARNRLETERVLTEARDQAEAGLRAKTDFLATMSHELRTPLNAIIGYAELLQDQAEGQLADNDRNDLGRIQSSGQLLLSLVNQVLDLAKIEAGRLEIQREAVAPGPLVEEVASVVTPMLTSQTTLSVDIAPHLPEITTDAGKLRQVLLNLASNACKFTKAGQVRLAVRPGPVSAGESLEFSIVDTGVGMSPEFVTRLFTPFTQAQGGAGSKFAGTGLGMAIAKRLSDTLGGTLVVRSTEGHGTAVSLLVPLESLSPGEAAA